MKTETVTTYVLSNGDRVPQNTTVGQSIEDALIDINGVLEILTDVNTHTLGATLLDALDAQAIIWMRA